MDTWFVLRVVWAFALIALVLYGLTYLVKILGRGRLIVSSERRLVSVVESTMIAQNTALHVVKIADKFYLVGGGMGHVALISELPADSIVPWIDQQKKSLGDQRDAVTSFLARFRKPS